MYAENERDANETGSSDASVHEACCLCSNRGAPLERDSIAIPSPSPNTQLGGWDKRVGVFPSHAPVGEELRSAFLASYAAGIRRLID